MTFFIATLKNFDYRVYISNVDKNDAVYLLNNFILSDKGVEIIKKGAFGGTYFRDIYFGVCDKFYKNSWKEFKELEGIDKKYYASNFMM